MWEVGVCNWSLDLKICTIMWYANKHLKKMGDFNWFLDLKICITMWFINDDLFCLDLLCCIPINIENPKFKKKSSYGGLNFLKSRSNVEVYWDTFIILFSNGMPNFPLRYIIVQGQLLHKFNFLKIEVFEKQLTLLSEIPKN